MGLTADNDDGADAAKPARNHDCTCHQIQKVTFKDSARFLNAALGKLTTNLRSRARPISCEDCEKSEVEFCSSCAEKDKLSDVFKRTYQYVTSKYDPLAFPILTSKQIYPYR